MSLRKIIAWVGGLCLVGLLAAPYFIGGQVERYLTQWTVGLSQFPGWQAKVLSFERGYRKSSAVTEVSHHGKTWRMTHQITHGPIVFGVPSQNTIEFAFIQTNLFDFFKFQTDIGFSGQNTTSVHNASVYTDESPNVARLPRLTKMVLGPFKGVVKSNASMDQFELDLGLSNLEYISPHAQAQLSDCRVQSVRQRSSFKAILTGNTQLVCQKVSINRGMQNLLTVNKFQFDITDSLRNQLVSLSETIQFDNLIWEGQSIGQGKSDIKFKGLSAACL